jgi:hypothetical protein
VPPGRYLIEPTDDERTHLVLNLKAGQMAIVHIERSLVGPDVPALEDRSWWTKRLVDSRHAFLEDQRPIQAHNFVDTWFRPTP